MTTLQEGWLQTVADECNLSAQSPEVTKLILPVVETQVKRIAILARKIQKRSKGNKMSVSDINLALKLSQQEEIYGLDDAKVIKSENGSMIIQAPKINLLDYSRATLPPCPLGPEVALHWLAIDDIQPNIIENPTRLPTSVQDFPIGLSNELQTFYERTTNAMRGGDGAKSNLRSIYYSLANDNGLQELVPYYSRFMYTEVRNTNRSVPLLRNLVRALHSMLRNPNLKLGGHLHQIMPAIFTCVVGVRLSDVDDENHWILRRAAAEVVATIVKKFQSTAPDLNARVCKTYRDAFARDKALVSVYGGIVGLLCIGQHVIRSVLLPSLPLLAVRLLEGTDMKDTNTIIIKTNTNTNTSNTPVEQKDGPVDVESAEMDIDNGDRKQSEEGEGEKPLEEDNEDEDEDENGKYGRQQRLLEAKHNQIVRLQCRAVLSEALGLYLKVSNRLNQVSTEPLTGTFSHDDVFQDKEAQALVTEIAESLVPFHVTSTTHLTECHAFI